MVGFPRRYLPSLRELATHVLDRRGTSGDPAAVARDLLAGFFDVCTHAGLDGVLVELAEAFAPLDLADASALAEEPRLATALAAMLGDRARFDAGGPRNAMPAQLAECLVATLGLELRDPPERSVALSDEVRREMIAALTGAVEVELAATKLRPAIVASARARCGEPHLKAFDKMVAQLDERGIRLPPQPRVPLHVVQAVQQALQDARIEIVARVANEAIDRAKGVLERASPDLAARIDAPITHRVTPRDVGVRRASGVAVPTPDAIVRVLFASLSEILELTWVAPAVTVRAYGASQTFAVGEVVEHPKFGRGTVKSASAKHIELELADSVVTLVHGRG